MKTYFFVLRNVPLFLKFVPFLWEFLTYLDYNDASRHFRNMHTSEEVVNLFFHACNSASNNNKNCSSKQSPSYKPKISNTLHTSYLHYFLPQPLQICGIVVDELPYKSLFLKRMNNFCILIYFIGIQFLSLFISKQDKYHILHFIYLLYILLLYCCLLL